MAVSNEYYYRKEIVFYISILLVSFLYFIWISRGGLFSRFCVYIFVAISSSALPFLHEGFIFFCGLYFAVILYSVATKILVVW